MEVSDRFQGAELFHRESADLMHFLGFLGFSLLHEYQLLSESIEQRRVKRYITSTYHVYLPDLIPESAGLAAQLLEGKDRLEISCEEVATILKHAFEVYAEWEENTLELYQKVAADLLKSGEISAFHFVSEIVRDVKEELTAINDMIIGFNAMDWDKAQIQAEQNTYFERYEKLARELLSGSQGIVAPSTRPTS